MARAYRHRAVRPTDCAAHALAAPREADRPGAGLPVHGVRRLMVMLRVVLALVVRQLCAAAHVVCRVCGACRTSPAVAHRSPSQLVRCIPRAACMRELRLPAQRWQAESARFTRNRGTPQLSRLLASVSQSVPV